MARIQLEGILKLIDVDINPAIFQKISRAVSNLPISFQLTSKAAKDATGNVNNLTGAVGRTNKQLSAGASFANKFLQRMAQFAILLPIFATLNKAIQGSVKFMTEFESELINIARVDPQGTLNKLGQISAAALDIGVQFGASSIEVIKTVKTFVQAGESIESALQKARVATLATQVSTLSLVQAQELLIGVSKQFREEALADIDVLDKVAKVEDLSAADAGELAEAFVTGGNALAFATKSFDDAIGIIAGLREQTRKSGREIGTFAKTLATRIFAAGESRTALEDLGVAVEDQSGKLRPLLAVLQDTKVAFDGMTEAEQANAAKAIAGVRQFESLLATLQALNKIQELSEGSSKSQGTALQKLAIVSEKLQFQVDSMIAEFQRLAVELGDAGVLDFFKDAVRAARAFATGLEGAVDMAKNLGVALVPLIAAGAGKLGQIAFRKGGPGVGRGGNIGSGEGSFGDPVQGPGGLVGKAAFARFAAFTAAAIGLNIAAEKLNDAFSETTGYVKSFGGSLTNITGSLAAGAQTAAILGPKYGKLAFAADLLIKTFSDLVKATDEAKAAHQDMVNEEKKTLGAMQVNREISVGGDFSQNIISALTDALGRQGGNVNAEFIGDAKKQIGSVIKSVRENTPGLTQAKNVDVEALLGSEGFLKAISKARPDFQGLSAAVKANSGPAQLLTAMLVDLGHSAASAGKVVENFVSGLNSLAKLRARDDLRQQESRINDLLVEREQLLRTGIPLFQSHVEQLKDQLEAMEKTLNVTAAMKEDFKQLGKQSPDALGFSGKGQEAADRAKKFFSDIEKAVLSVNKTGEKFNLTEFLDKFNFSLAETDADGADTSDSAVSKRFEAAQEFVKILESGLTNEVKKLELIKNLQDSITTQEIEKSRAQVETMQQSVEIINNAQAAFAKLGVTADTTKDDLDQLANITAADLDAVTNGTDTFGAGLRSILQTLAGNDLQQAEQQVRISSEGFIKAIEDIDKQISMVRDTIGSMNGDVDQASGKSRVELEKELGALETKRLSLTFEAQQESIKGTVDLIRARKKADEEAAQKAKELAQALEALADAELNLKNGTDDAIRSFREFTASTQTEMFEKEAAARAELQSAQQDLIASSSSLDDAYQGLKDAIVDFNDTMAAARFEVGLLGIQMAALDGGLNTISSRVSALNQVFNSSTKDANISLKERISLERQLANETIQFLQNARNEITNAGLDVFGQSPEENAQLQQGIQGLQLVADKLGGSFDAFSKMSPEDFDKVSEELLSLPTEFRQQILDALRLLPSSMNIGGFSSEQLQNALGQVGAGVNEEAGLPAIVDLMSQEKEQLARLQELAIREAELQIHQVVAADEQVELAKTALEASEIQAERASEELVSVQEELVSQNEALTAAADQREKLTAQLLGATDIATVKQIEAQAREFANQVPYFTDISDKLLEVVQAIGSLKVAQFSAAEAVPAAGRGWIPNYAGGKLTSGEAFGLLRAGAREKRMMPGGAGLAVANTSETIIPSRFGGHIPNFANGSQIASSIQAVNGTNAAVVAAIANSINSLISKTKDPNQEDTARITVDKLNSILSTLQEISLSNTSIDTAVNAEDTTETTTGPTAIQPVNINVTTNGRNVVQVAGLENLEQALKDGIARAQVEQADKVIAPVNDAVRAIFTVLRERGLMSSFGQGS